MPSEIEDIVGICARHLRDDEVERLVAWIAARVGRQQGMAGDRPPLERLRHVVTHWLSRGERSDLLAWLSRRAALGAPLVPGAQSSQGVGEATGSTQV